jgi:hypothetical protein|tara:strand:+ start:603 stop:725 length:123 start_codon:yes stop_codon:yes gene_type:complete
MGQMAYIEIQKALLSWVESYSDRILISITDNAGAQSREND